MPAPDRALVQLVVCAVVTVLTIAIASMLLVANGFPSRDTLTFWCVVAPVSLIDWALHSTALGLWLLLAIAIAAAARVLGRARVVAAELSAAARQARLPRLPGVVASAARAVGIDDVLDVVDAPRPFAFVYGCRRPRICVSSGLVARLTDEELMAVLYHERWHLWRRDPARLLLVRAIAAGFAFVPAVPRLAEQHALAMELAADRHAATAMGGKRWLASALTKVASHDLPAASAGGAGLADARAAALAEDSPPDSGRVDRRLATLLVAEFVVVALIFVQGTSGPLRRLWIAPVC